MRRATSPDGHRDNLDDAEVVQRYHLRAALQPGAWLVRCAAEKDASGTAAAYKATHHRAHIHRVARLAEAAVAVYDVEVVAQRVDAVKVEQSGRHIGTLGPAQRQLFPDA
jgi:hypothetical protein